MTVEEMTAKIIEFVRGYQPASLVELTRRLGKDAEGDHVLHFPSRPNTVIWTGLSDMFIDAFFAAKTDIWLDITNPMIYMMDGGLLDMPIAKRYNKTDYKTEHWVPVVLRLKTEAEKARRMA